MTGVAGERGGLVVELSLDNIAGSYCARTLRSLGMRVVKVEPPAGDPLRLAPPLLRRGPPGESSGLFQYLNAGKESVVADIASPSGWGEIERLVARADMVILGVDGDAEMVDSRQRHIAAINPSSVRIVLSPYGLTGPYRNLAGSDLTDWAASGYMYVTGQPDREPLAGGGPYPAYTAGLTAAIGGLAAWRDARDGGPGRLVDVGVMESMAALHQWTLTQYTYQGYIKQRVGNRHGDFHHPVAFLECSDGWVCIAAAGAVQWKRLSQAVGLPELVTDSRFQSSGERFEHADEVDAALRPWLLSHTCEEVAAILQDHRVPAAVVTDVARMLDDRQLRSRSFFQTIDVGGAPLDMPGSPFRLGETVTWTAAPRLGADSARVLSEMGDPGGGPGNLRSTGTRRTDRVS